MFVVQYDLSDMPSNSQSFIRQKTYYMPKSITSNSESKPFTAAGSKTFTKPTNKISNSAPTNQTPTCEPSPLNATSLNSSNKRNSTSKESGQSEANHRPANGLSNGLSNHLTNGKSLSGKGFSVNGLAGKSMSTNGQSSNGLPGKTAPANLTVSLSTTDLSSNLPTNLTATRSKSISSKSYSVSSSSKELDDTKLCKYQFSSSFLRYLIHLRFLSTKSGKIYLHRDIRILILKKNEFDPGNLSQTPTYHWVSEQITEITEQAASSKYSLRWAWHFTDSPDRRSLSLSSSIRIRSNPFCIQSSSSI